MSVEKKIDSVDALIMVSNVKAIINDSNIAKFGYSLFFAADANIPFYAVEGPDTKTISKIFKNFPDFLKFMNIRNRSAYNNPDILLNDISENVDLPVEKLKLGFIGDNYYTNLLAERSCNGYNSPMVNQGFNTDTYKYATTKAAKGITLYICRL